MGVEGYYEKHGAEYVNPREEEVRKALAACLTLWTKEQGLVFGSVLDLACGSGEATLVVERWAKARNLSVVVNATDPFTYDAFEARVGRKALRFGFEDIEAGELEKHSFDLIVSSFAMHLVEEDRLFSTCQQMALNSKFLIVVSPHKRPFITAAMGWILKHENIVGRIKSRLYSSIYY
uniref:Methyltransferase domain-containing protein n=1 Tax=Arcella intermedia TaxID=1963864 RepID=A0A6B2LK95_9EUKA